MEEDSPKWYHIVLDLLVKLAMLAVAQAFTTNVMMAIGLVYPYDEVIVKSIADKVINNCILFIMSSGLPLVIHTIQAAFMLLKRSPTGVSSTEKSTPSNTVCLTNSVVDIESNSNDSLLKSSFEEKELRWIRKNYGWVTSSSKWRSPLVMLILGLAQLISIVFQAAIAVLSWLGTDTAPTYPAFIPFVILSAGCGVISSIVLKILSVYYQPPISPNSLSKYPTYP